jgi:hypothetical protein
MAYRFWRTPQTLPELQLQGTQTTGDVRVLEDPQGKQTAGDDLVLEEPQGKQTAGDDLVLEEPQGTQTAGDDLDVEDFCRNAFSNIDVRRH